MRTPRFTGAALLLALAVSACSDQLVDPPMEAEGPALSVQESESAPQHLVMFKGNQIPSSFAGDVADAGGTILFSHDVGFALVSGLDDAGADALASEKYVSDFAADETFMLDDIVGGTASGAAGVASHGDPTTAFFYPRQWNMRAISADQAWAAGRTGSSDVTVAILDTGIDYLYPDLVGRVDLSRSASFVPFDDFLTSLFFPGRHVITDLHYHGTHVAATAVSNGLVAAGVTSGATLMGIKVCSVAGGCSFGAVISGVLHAADNGADVANMSLGGGFTKAGNGRLVGFIQRVFNYSKSQGMTIVVAAGNGASDLQHNGNFFASYCDTSAVVCVSATAPTAGDGPNGPWTDVDAPAAYTNYGSNAINVAAPGGANIANSAGWVWAACSGTSLVAPICGTGTFIIGISGTSMATPHVAGLAALIVEDVGRKPGQVKSRLQQTADDLGPNGTDPFYGKGRINAAAATGTN